MMTTDHKAVRRNYLLDFLLALSLIYYFALILDLLLRPTALGVNFEGLLSVFDRFFEATLGTLVIAIGLFIMRRVPGNQAGPLLVIYGAGTTGWSIAQNMGSPYWTSLAHLFFSFFWGSVVIPAGIVLLFCFPDSHPYPRRVKPWLVLYVLIMAVETLLALMARPPGFRDLLGYGDLPQNPLFAPALEPYFNLLYGQINIVLILLGIGGATLSLVLRYRAASARARLQIKWVIWVGSVSVLLVIVEEILTAGNSYSAVAGSPLALVLLILFYGLVGTAPVIGIGLAILRSRLWEIDVIIRRTLIYSVLTAVLILIYLVSVIILQQLSRRIIGQTSDLAVILSTLAIAALFAPIRLFLQRLIDHRFYRDKYNAGLAIEAFSRSVREGVDPDAVTQSLLAVVQDALQPEVTGIWLVSDHDPARQP